MNFTSKSANIVYEISPIDEEISFLKLHRITLKETKIIYIMKDSDKSGAIQPSLIDYLEIA